MVCLAQTRHAAVVSYEEGAALASILRVLKMSRHVALLDALVVVGEDGRYVDAVGAGHAVVALVARNGLEVVDVLRYLHEEPVLLLGDGLQGRVCPQVLLQVLHVCHSAQYRQHSRWRASEAEGPRSHAVLMSLCLHLLHYRVGHVGQSSAQQRLHDYRGYAPLLQFAVEIDGIGITWVYLVGVVPVEIVQFYLHEVPMVASLVVPFQQHVVDGYVAVV